MSNRRLLVPLLITCLAACFAASSVAAKGKSKSKSKETAAMNAPSPDDLVWRGDTATGRAIMDDLAKQYAKDKKGTIRLEPFSTLSGLDAVAKGTADIAGSARGKYAKRGEEANLDFLPVALDGAVLITHPDNPVNNLTVKQIHDIYYGRIKNWKELGGADREINLYAIASPLDGVEYSLRELIFRNGDQRVAAPRLYINTTKLEEAITLDPAGLGLSTMANSYSNKGVKMLSVEGVAPSVASVTDGTYPLFITLYLADRNDSPKQAAITKFVDFLTTPEAKEILRKHHLTPYADANDVIGKNTARMSFIDAHVGRDAAAVAATALVNAPTPVSAPRATLEAKRAIAPAAESTDQARENLARAEAAKAAKKEESERAARRQSAAVAKVPSKESPTKPVVKTSHATPKKEVAKAAKKETPAAKKPVAKTQVAASKKAQKPAAAKTPAKKTAVAATKPAPAKKKASFDNVTGGTDGG